MIIQLSNRSPILFPIENEILELDQPIEQIEALKHALIKKIALSCLAEIAIGSVITATACCFVAAPLIPSFIAILITTIALTTLMHVIQTALSYEILCCFIRQGKTTLAQDEIERDVRHLPLKFAILTAFRSLGRPQLFATLDNLTHGTLVHEMGHALAAWLLFMNSDPAITIHLQGGYTEFYVRKLTALGEWLGYNRSRLLVTAAGPGLAMIDASLLLILAHFVKESHPDWHQTLLHIAINRVANHVIYALSALFPMSAEKALSHDFHYLWKHGGIHPIAAAVAMTALPLLVHCALTRLTGNNDYVDL